ncbi:thioredoxin-dependent thiol peroxidase [Candidatus Kaiserbacteria bacterium CG10_big_fil_rev_8_21_14_0_10_49_17]|uniref:thioredoxin-dependent peroxiredoxin n=1 Tax=Candidatus Kaiserbacteria bacterium CG10_big_fil_rev_8_21_14_0_10_49_17 TaxID=1974609 RepID=A0A2M6WEN8_9BACT|nr:MAG: thioredoxin-dependent thiol peroxidase [Candidatus Kaiserbacteria bacterium CG10_big_fil_rev_8_21_14_0_10_49_17]
MKKTLIPGVSAPEFRLPDQNGKERSLADFSGKWVVLYFYPKDDTPGCTTEAKAFKDANRKLQQRGAVVVGISPDSPVRHSTFIKKYALPFLLLSDENKKVLRTYGVWKKKKFMGREYMGVLRETLLIDPNGTIAKVYEKVTPATHADEIITDLTALQKT